MDRFWERVASLDRRIIFLLVLVAVIAGVLWPTRPDVRPATEQAFTTVHNLAPGQLVFLGMSLGTGSEPLVEQARVLMRHLLSRGARVLVAVPEDVPGDAVRSVLQDFDAQAARLGDKLYGVDYAVVTLQARATGAETFAPLAERLAAGIGPFDATGRPAESVRLLSEFKSLRRARLIIGLALRVEGAEGRLGLTDYVLAGRLAGSLPVVGGIPANSSPAVDRLLNTGDLAGALLGARGAAEYDGLLGGGTGFGRQWGGTSMFALLLAALVVLTTVADRMRGAGRAGAGGQAGGGRAPRGAIRRVPRPPRPAPDPTPRTRDLWPPGPEGE